MPVKRTWTSSGNEVVQHLDEAGNVYMQYSGICPHFGGPLLYDEKKKVFRCPWHDWIFDESGKCINRQVSCKINNLIRF